MLTWRAFHQRLIAMAMVSALPRVATASVGTGVPAPEQFFNRMSFGGNDASRADYAALGAKAWLEAQLAIPVGNGRWMGGNAYECQKLCADCEVLGEKAAR